MGVGGVGVLVGLGAPVGVGVDVYVGAMDTGVGVGWKADLAQGMLNRSAPTTIAESPRS
jgi:hypothetical protein